MFVSSPVLSLLLSSSLANVPSEKVECKNGGISWLIIIFDGCFVCLSSDSEHRQDIKIWRDTGAFQSVILRDVLSFNEKSAQGSAVVVKGFGGGFFLCL